MMMFLALYVTSLMTCCRMGVGFSMSVYSIGHIPGVNTLNQCWINVGLTLDRLRRRPNIYPTLLQCVLSAEIYNTWLHAL